MLIEVGLEMHKYIVTVIAVIFRKQCVSLFVELFYKLVNIITILKFDMINFENKLILLPN